MSRIERALYAVALVCYSVALVALIFCLVVTL